MSIVDKFEKESWSLERTIDDRKFLNMFSGNIIRLFEISEWGDDSPFKAKDVNILRNKIINSNLENKEKYLDICNQFDEGYWLTVSA